MLSTHCSSCGSPLFKINNEIVCPVCETRLIEEKDLKDDKKRKNLYNEPKTESTIKDGERIPEIINFSRHDIPKQRDIVNEDLEKYIEKKVLSKILDIFEEIETEKDLTKIQKGLNCIKDLIDIIKLLKDIS